MITTWTSDNDKQLGSSTFITVKVHYFGLFIHILNLRSLRKQLIFCNATTGWPFTTSPLTWSPRSNHGLGKCYTKFILGKFPRRIALTIWPNQSIHRKTAVEEWTWYQRGPEQMEHKIPFRIFRSEKQDKLFRCSTAPGNVLLKRPQNSCSTYSPPGFSRNVS